MSTALDGVGFYDKLQAALASLSASLIGRSGGSQVAGPLFLCVTRRLAQMYTYAANVVNGWKADIARGSLVDSGIVETQRPSGG
jgi:hypothetical protein